MQLYRAKIVNFRSLKDVELTFDQKCRILVGINESGKSNILKALALLDPERPFQTDDIRDALPDESPDFEAYIRFVFKLSTQDRENCLEALQAAVLAPSSKTAIVIDGDHPMTLAQFVDSRTEALYSVDLRSKKRMPQMWRLPGKLRIADGWIAPKDSVPDDVTVQGSDGEAVALNKFSLVHESCAQGIDSARYDEATIDILDNMLRSVVHAYVADNLPSCLYWTYSEASLLPGQIVLDNFAANPSSCEPLRQMFVLAGFSDVSKAIAEAKTRKNGIRNLLNRVAETATKHIRSIWKEYRAIQIELAPNGLHIDASVKDRHNVYSFDRRSDGFKRFVSFLLLVSAKVRNEELYDTLYLHDEPDTGLHPSGARYLRDELIRIAKDNYVVFSTHSIFMIDRERIDRHLIVRKKDEVTTVDEANESNIADEEVLYNALGYSLFETLRPRNIIFEGWRDKRLFLTAVSGSSPRAKKLKKAVADVGVCHARGVKDIGRVAPMLELAGRWYMVVSDGDQPAIEHQREYKGNGPWVRYDELNNVQQAVTSEDLLKPEAFKAAILQTMAAHPALPKIDLVASSQPRMIVVKNWLKAAGLDGENLREALNQFKEAVYNSLKPSHIEDRYFDICDAILERIEAAAT